MFAIITYLVDGYPDPASQLIKIGEGQSEETIATAFTRSMRPVTVSVVHVKNYHPTRNQNRIMPKTESTLSLHTLWRNCYHLHQRILLHQKRSILLQMEINGLTEPADDRAIATDPRIVNLQQALAAAIPLFKNSLDQELSQAFFEDQLLGDDEADPNSTDF